MDWISKLEKKFGKYAIPHLMRYIIVLYGIGFIIEMVAPNFYLQYLSLDARAILGGQIWRIFTFLIQPPTGSIIFVVFALYLYYMIGTALEATWSAFRFNIYIFSGVLFHVLAAIIAYLITGVSFPLGTAYLNLSLFFAFAALYPNMQFLLFFVIPVKVKYLAWINAAFFAYSILQAFLPAYGGDPMFGFIYKSSAIAAFVSILNFLLYFFSSSKFAPYKPKEVKRKQVYKREVQRAKAEENTFEGGARHKCSVCGRTELDDPSLQFRYCSKCSGNHEYCSDHLFTHQHIQ